MNDFDDSLEVQELIRRLKDVGEPPRWERPAARVWDTIEAETGVGQAPGAEPAARAETSAATAPTTGGGFDRRTALLVAAGVAVGAIGSAAVLSLRNRDAPPDVLQRAVLSPLDDSDKHLGQAWLVREDGHLRLRVETTPISRQPGHYIEVWLINRDLKRMLTVGILASGDRGTFPVDQAAIDEGYDIVDLSIEPFDDQPAHSGATIMRGALRQ